MFCSFKPRTNRKYWCPVWAIVLHLPLPSGCLCSWKILRYCRIILPQNLTVCP